ncbi:MAG TPA: hypothetical protein GX518_05340 [Firmicutes bacterium]|nr:hypothetical protein [Bacillota bacterium]
MPHWTPEEEKLLRELYPTADSAELERIFGRKLSAIIYKANSLNLKRERYWKEEEIEILKEMYPSSDTEEVARRLKRSVFSIRNKAARLGLTKSNRSAPKRWSGEEIELLRQLYPTKATKELVAVFGRSAGAIRAKAWDLKLKKKRGQEKGDPRGEPSFG